MPVQLIIAGKAHPKDNPGKQLIREIVQLTRDPVMSRHVVFLEDYDIQVGRELVQGVDLWLNNPRRGEEACGTSGMKAALNGTLNCSILDGWYDEAYETSGGWAIGDRSPYTPDQDELHASEIYSLLENEILPMYYKNREEGVPAQWMQRVKQCLMNMSPAFNCQRMIHEYTTRLYEPAHANFAKLRADSFEMSKEKWSWVQRVESSWPRVQIKEAASDLGACHITGSPIKLRAAVDLAGLEPGDVRVEAVVGHVGTSGALEDLTILTLAPDSVREGIHVFERKFVPHQTGRLGFTFRVSPNHSDDPLARPCGAPMKWAV
jgi:starch phosphorylase